MAERLVDVLVVRWYERRDSASDAARRWIAAAEEHLPEALPKRFGETEPLRGRGDPLPAYAAATSLFLLAGSRPVYHGSLSAGGYGPVAGHSLHAVLDAGDDRVRRFALAMAGPGTFYVSASVSRGQTLDRNTLWGPGQGEEPFLAPLGEWLGLAPEPPAWCWFGPAYARMLRRTDPLWTGGPWVPDRFQARLTEVDPARRHAPSMPRGLRSSLWRILVGQRPRPS